MGTTDEVGLICGAEEKQNGPGSEVCCDSNRGEQGIGVVKTRKIFVPSFRRAIRQRATPGACARIGVIYAERVCCNPTGVCTRLE
jgi:hypothetical protein